MTDYIFLMHDDAAVDEQAWEPYLRGLQGSGCFQGGSEIGDGICVQKNGAPTPRTSHLTGFIRVSAGNLDQAKALLVGNPVFEAGGTVEIRELPRSD
jgi:hypothetical protein